MHQNTITLTPPDWLAELTHQHRSSMPDAEERLRLAIDLSRRNIEQGTGGPFGAAVFDLSTFRLVGAGVNRVVPTGLSIAHAEIMALSDAQLRLGTFDLSTTGAGRFELVTSCEPCAMCFGAIPWSGIRSLLCGATDQDARAIGFDEGPRHPNWIEELERRGITVHTEICRDAGRQVLQDYANGSGTIYNGRSSI